MLALHDLLNEDAATDDGTEVDVDETYLQVDRGTMWRARIILLKLPLLVCLGLFDLEMVR